MSAISSGSSEGAPAPLSVRAHAPARIGPTIVERKPFGPSVPDSEPSGAKPPVPAEVRLRPAVPHSGSDRSVPVDLAAPR